MIKRFNKKIKYVMIIIFIVMILFSIFSFAITETDNGIMKVKRTEGGLEFDGLFGYDVQGYIKKDENTNEKILIGSTFSNDGYHTFLNVNGLSGEMNGKLTDEEGEEGKTWKEKAASMQYTEYSEEGWQTINGINIKLSTQFVNDGEQLQIIYDLKNTTNSSAIISLATVSDVQIDQDDSATIERLEDGSGVRLWTKEGFSNKPVQFVFYGKNVPGTTSIDNLWIGDWGYGEHIRNMFSDNSDVPKIEDTDSSFAYSWVNKTINAGENQRYTVLMEVGEINIPNTGITLDNNTKFYYEDVKMNGTVIDKDLKDKITVHYEVDGTEYTLPVMSTDGSSKDFELDLTSLNLEAVTNHTLKVWAVDSTDCSSNVEERVFTITYLKEPELSLSTTEWAKDVSFKIIDTINEADYVSKYQYRLNDGTWVDCSKDMDIPIEESGQVKIYVRIMGTCEGDYSNIVTATAKVDKINPTTIKPTASKSTSSITLNLEQTDSYSGIDMSKTMYAIKNDGTWGDWQYENVFTGLTHNTEYVVKTKAVDNVGNTSESEELTLKTDELLLGNLILKLNNANGNEYIEDTWTNQNIYIAIEERCDGAITKYKSKENSAEIIAETNQETTIATNGITNLLLSVSDGTNTITSDVENILKIDKVVPIINKLVLDNEDWTKESKTITGKAIDSLSGIIAYQFSNQENLTNSSNGWIEITQTNTEISQIKEITENGKIYFYVKDAANNIAVVGIDTKIDSQGPVISFSRASGETEINVTDTGAGVKTIEYAWTEENSEPSDWIQYSSAVSYDGVDMGKIMLWARAKDGIGNLTVSSTIFSSLKDPNIISDEEIINKRVSFKITSETDDTDVLYQFKINEGNWENISKDSIHTITDITDGNVKISARILDNAGRCSKIIEKIVKITTTEGNVNDNTTATGRIPQTGVGVVSVLVVIMLIGVCTISFMKYK